MSKAPRTRSLVEKFGRDLSGTLATTFAIAILPLFAVLGAATDYVRASSVEARLQSALDAAALAAASSRGLREPERVKLATDLFNKNWTAASETAALKSSPKFVVSNGAVKGSAKVALPTSIMRVAGIDSMDIESKVTVNIPGEMKAEIALVLDYSGSMTEKSGGKVKYIAMREAAQKLVGDLEQHDSNKLKVGLVPFSHHVYVTLPKQYVIGQKGGGSWTGCTQDRQYPYNLTDSTPGKDDKSKWGQPQASMHLSNGCSGYAPNKLKVLPLTSDISVVKTQLAQMKPYTWTHIALGVEFGFHVLSPNAPFGEGADYRDKQTRKFMVVLTDGEQTEPAFGPAQRTVEQGEKNLEELCQNAKDKGITMITVAFDLHDDPTKNRLRDCSSDPDKYFFIAENDDEVAKAFEEIKTKISQQVYLSR